MPATPRSRTPMRWPPTNRQLVLGLMPNHPQAVSVAQMKEKTGLSAAGVSGVMNILVAEKVFERADEGETVLYRKAPPRPASVASK